MDGPLGVLATPGAAAAGSGMGEERSEGASTRLSSVQLSVERLDALINQVGELGASFNQLRYALARGVEETGTVMDALGQQLLRLQGEVLQYRLQPIGRIWEPYHRLVRDLSVETGKRVVLEFSGEETEVDRNILLALKESLGHLIRNSIDHGIESPGARLAAGKAEVGHVWLSAVQEEGQVLLTLADDGGGIDLARVRVKAVERGLITPSQAAEWKDSELIRLITSAGFSTADQVSRISGRGTGLDVVENAVLRIGGSMTITSEPGKGARFLLRIPQSMAIVPVLLVEEGAVSYAIPQANIVELLSFYGSEILSQVEGKIEMPMVRVRDRLLPLIPFGRVLARSGGGDRSGFRELERIRARRELHVVVLQCEGGRFGLEVEKIGEPMNPLIKPVGRAFSHIHLLGGMVVMADGGVAFLLNVAELHSHVG
ncbi:MAG: chemotaxis protein CheW [Magnetococcales bacterium]|nr:chemotaxis protein CheW [Magnetococcales bacterium]